MFASAEGSLRFRAADTHTAVSFGLVKQIEKMDVVKETLNVAGLLTNVYAPSGLRDKRSSEPVVVLFFLHGRGSSADAIDPTARAAFAWVAEKQASSSKQSPRDFIVVTFVRGSLALEMVLELTGPCGLAGPAEPWQEDGGRTRKPGMEPQGGRAQ